MRVRIAGRLVARRRHGYLGFADLRDGTGRIQLFLDIAVLGADAHRAVDALRLGDWVGATGTVMTDDVPFTPVQRVARRAVGVLNPFFLVRSQHDFNAKFDPQWLPRVLAYRNPADLPRVGLLYAGAEGFLAVPGLGPLFVPAVAGGAPSPSAPASP
ncbi:OB-fold nucleic acid binding domain-containing protein [Actinomycetospora termitidis]|uniref:OB-fold nucleic acid binding domain-containing protein n=1 Tax=Actinomycetospora termitidis TaxID=3053470 RepID=A0ABT7M1X5_9PSEU|nr:OB-fold nucleic acid binding domain-containing protein [Actinomycetospora sp. Odt1-22]MDL5154654.1 OB-fold nucleic acid binding domain-containing protein [Actinomycetospora sp. Odt1-22]